MANKLIKDAEPLKNYDGVINTIVGNKTKYYQHLYAFEAFSEFLNREGIFIVAAFDEKEAYNYLDKKPNLKRFKFSYDRAIDDITREVNSLNIPPHIVYKITRDI